MTLEDMEAVNTDTVSVDTLTQYVAMLVGENENIKQQMTAMLDRQDRVGDVWAKFIMAINTQTEQQQNGNNSI